MNHNRIETEHEKFWKGEFGDEYIQRSKLDSVSSNINFFSEVFRNTCGIESVLELGCNVGNNLKAIGQLIPNAELHGVEINSKAVDAIRSDNININVKECSIMDYSPEEKFDFVFVKAVLIHIDPNSLNSVYKKIYDCAGKYILIAEYYNPTPISVNYRGNNERLYKRDFAGEFIQLFKNTKLISYGFRYHKDNSFPQDDISWFLLKKGD